MSRWAQPAHLPPPLVSRTPITFRALGLVLRLALVVSVVTAASFAPLARAAGASESFERGRELYRSAAEAQQQGDLERALGLYQAAFRAYPGYDVAAALARVELALGQYARAATHLRYAQARVPLTESDEFRQQLEDQLVEVRRRVGRLVVKVLPDTAQFTVDGQSSERDVFLPPGRYEIGARLEGYSEVREVVDLQAARTERVELLLTPLAAAPALLEPELYPDAASRDSKARGASRDDWDNTPPVVAESERRPGVLWVGGALSLALAGGATGFSLAANAAADELREHRESDPDASCGASQDTEFCRELQSLAEKQDRRDTIAKVAWVGFGVSVAATVLTYALWTRSEPDEVALDVQLSSESLYVGIGRAF